VRGLVALACLPLCASPSFGSGDDGVAPRYELRLAAESALDLQAFWEPCVQSRFGVFDATPALHAPVPARATAHYGADAFRAFVPHEPVALGEVWKVEESAALTFLRQFHEGATEKGRERGEVPGTYACLRAISDDAFEILLRVHAVFDLGDVLFKPAQFEGRLVVDRASGTLRSFRLELPSRNPNVDASRRGNSHRPPRADIGWMPRMELSSEQSPAVTWSHEVPLEEARTALRRAFYEFASLDWLPLDEALRTARETQKPLHLMVLLGALDDDSC